VALIEHRPRHVAVSPSHQGVLVAIAINGVRRMSEAWGLHICKRPQNAMWILFATPEHILCLVSKHELHSLDHGSIARHAGLQDLSINILDNNDQ
jgi:hypothetical protein